MCLHSHFRHRSVRDFTQSHWKNGHFSTARYPHLRISSISTLPGEFRQWSDSPLWDKAQQWDFQRDLDKPKQPSKSRADSSKSVFFPLFCLLYLLHFNLIGKISPIMIFFFSGYTEGMKVYRAITTVNCDQITPTSQIKCTFKNRCNQEASAKVDIHVINGMIMF